MHNVLIISYIAFPIGKLFILPESFLFSGKICFSGIPFVYSVCETLKIKPP